MKRLIAGLAIGAFIGLVSPAGASSTVQAMFAKFNFVVNGEVKNIDTEPLLYEGTTYLPIRAVSDMLGYDVNYKADSRTIELRNISVQQNEGEDMVGLNYKMTLREIIELIADKHNLSEDNYDVSMEGSGRAKFRGQEFQLEYEEDSNGRRYYNVQPLMDAGILTIEDLN